MLDRETLCALLTGMSQNMAFNVGFIPKDKLRWKPAPTANSALEIVGHVIGALGALTNSPGAEPVADAEQARQRLEEATQRFVSRLREATPEEMAQPTGSFQLPMSQFAALLVADTINHHGQITYIQTLLGDTESHFSPGVLEALA